MYLREQHAAPALLIGHSLGGAAVLAAAGRVAEAKAVVTIGAPSDPGHVSHLFGDDIDRIEADGEAEVILAGRPFTIKKTVSRRYRRSEIVRCDRVDAQGAARISCPA